MTSTHDGPAADSGIGIVEIVIAMFLLALLAVATLPLFVSTLTLTSGDSTVTTATQLVDEQLTLARSQTATCGALTTFAGTAVAATTDGTGKALTTTRSVTCPASYPGTARFTATVKAGLSTKASATTLIYVSAA
jgi:type II secretory pathway pseudopilin PulG